MRQSLFFNKVAGSRNFIKKETLAQVFSCEFCAIFKNIVFHRTPPATASAASASLKSKMKLFVLVHRVIAVSLMSRAPHL